MKRNTLISLIIILIFIGIFGMMQIGQGRISNPSTSTGVSGDQNSEHWVYNSTSKQLSATTSASSVGVGTTTADGIFDVATSTLGVVFSIDQSGNVATGTWQGSVISSTYIQDSYIKLVGDTTGAMTEDLNLDNGMLVISYDDDRIGIGTTSPTTYFSVATTSNTAFFNITDSGYVGIGTVAPDELLEIEGAATSKVHIDGAASAHLEVDRGTTGNSASINFQTANSSKVNIGMDGDGTDNFHIGDTTLFATKWLTIDTSSGKIGIGTSSPTAYFSVATSSNTALFVIDDNGHVGIGTTTPAEELQVHGDIRADETIYFDKEYDNGNSGTSTTITWGNGNKQKVTCTGATTTFVFVAPGGPSNLILKYVQDGVGSRTVASSSWPATLKWPSDISATSSTGATDIDIVSCYYDGTNYYCQGANNFE